jgi:hypothetical protein
MTVYGLFEIYLAKIGGRGHADGESERTFFMAAGEIRLPAYGKDPGTAKAAERQAREARQDAERYARRGNMTMHAISLQAAKELEAAVAAHHAPAAKERG